MRLRPGSLAACAASLVLLSAFSASAHKVRVGTPDATAFAFAPIAVGMSVGIFAKHELDVERIDFAGGSKLHQGMAAGAIDLSVGGNTDLAFVAKGVPETAIAVTAGAPVDFAVVVRMDGEIRQPSDLKNKMVGVTSETSLTSYLALALSRREGWGNTGIKRAYVGNSSSEVTALLVKNVDAIVVPLENGVILESEGKGRRLVGFDDMHMFITHVMSASNAWLRERPDLIAQFVAAWFETVKWMSAHKEETVRMVLPVTGLSPAQAAQVYDLEVPAMSTDGRFDDQAVAATMQSFVDVGFLDRIPNGQQLYTEKFLP